MPAAAPQDTGLDLKAFQNLGYTGEWFVFAGFVLFMWFRLFRREAEAARDAKLGLVPDTDRTRVRAQPEPSRRAHAREGARRSTGGPPHVCVMALGRRCEHARPVDRARAGVGDRRLRDRRARAPGCASQRRCRRRRAAVLAAELHRPSATCRHRCRRRYAAAPSVGVGVGDAAGGRTGLRRHPGELHLVRHGRLQQHGAAPPATGRAVRSPRRPRCAARRRSWPGRPRPSPGSPRCRWLVTEQSVPETLEMRKLPYTVPSAPAAPVSAEATPSWPGSQTGDRGRRAVGRGPRRCRPCRRRRRWPSVSEAAAGAVRVAVAAGALPVGGADRPSRRPPSRCRSRCRPAPARRAPAMAGLAVSSRSEFGDVDEGGDRGADEQRRRRHTDDGLPLPGAPGGHRAAADGRGCRRWARGSCDGAVQHTAQRDLVQVRTGVAGAPEPPEPPPAPPDPASRRPVPRRRAPSGRRAGPLRRRRPPRPAFPALPRRTRRPYPGSRPSSRSVAVLRPVVHNSVSSPVDRSLVRVVPARGPCCSRPLMP